MRRVTKPKHPWTNGQVEPIIEAAVKRFHYETHDQLRQHLGDFIDAYNFARRLKALSGLTPTNTTAKSGQKEPDRFKVDPTHQSQGLNR